FASAHDLVRFGLFHLKAHLPDQAAILSDSSIDEMHKPTANTGPHSGYGIGWATTDANGYPVVSHTGGMGGVATVLRLIPSEKLAVVVLTNAATQLPGKVADEIMKQLLPKWQPAGPSPPRPHAWPKELIGKWKGK